MSSIDDTLHPLPIVPLTLSMEILAEAGALLVPQKVLIGIKSIRAYRWISLENNNVRLKIVAQVNQNVPKEVRVQVYKLDEGEEPIETLVIEGIAVFAATYPEIPSTYEFSLEGERASKWQPERLYTEGMFHGPSWQAVSSVDRWGENGSLATLEVLPANGFFRSKGDPRFLTAPIVLDAAGQIVGFWAMEHLERGFIVFPYRVKALHIYGPRLPVGGRVKCQARVELMGKQQVSSNIDIVGEDGRLWMRLEAWEDKRFDLPSRVYAFLLSPIEMMASIPWDVPVASSSNSSSLFCHRIDRLFQGDESFWRQVFAHLILNAKERETFRKLGKSEKRLNHWLLGRVVAKDAVRAFLKERYGMELGPADVEITSDEYGRPIPTGIWAKQVECIPSLSLAHTEGMALAIAGHSDGSLHVGIDVERIRPLEKEFETAAFTPHELDLLNAFNDPERQQWLLRFWCAKEALAKALGRVLPTAPLNFEVEELDALEEKVKLSLQKKVVETFPDIHKEAVSVQTIKEDNYIIACTVFESNGDE
jgi:phosphopantetheine--protein transferase-like protein